MAGDGHGTVQQVRHVPEVLEHRMGEDRGGRAGGGAREPADCLFQRTNLRGSGQCTKACEQYGYASDRLKLRMYVGGFASGHEQAVRAYLGRLDPPVEVIGLSRIVSTLVSLADKRTYIDDPVVMTVKALAHAGRLAGAPTEATL